MDPNAAPPATDHALARGLQALQAQQPQQALQLLQAHLRQAPQSIDAWNAQGLALKRLGRWAQAADSFDHALRLDPNALEVLVNRAHLHWEQGEAAACVALCQRALQRAPDMVAAMVNLALALNAQSQPQAAIAWLRQAQQLQRSRGGGELAMVRLNLALMLLQTGAWAEAWPLYESRFEVPGSSASQVVRAREPGRWQGERAHSPQTLLVYAEQGLGDSLQFCRHLPDLLRLGYRVVFEVQDPLVGLMRSLHPDITVCAAGQYDGPVDAHTPLLSLPGLLGLRPEPLAQTPAGPYLWPQAERLAHWRQALHAHTDSARPCVGLVWRGLTRHPLEARRSLPLDALLACLPQALQVVVLQKELSRAERQQLRQRPHTWLAGSSFQDFHDTAALASQLDLVISIDTSVAHLAGAIGQSCWVLLPHLADWRWQLAEQHSPWYADTRLWRQRAPGDWASVLAPLRQALAQRYPDGARAKHKDRSAEAAFAQAVQAHEAGHIAQAAQACRQALQEDPAHGHALHLYGVCLHKLGHSDAALHTLERAIALRPDEAALYNSLGIVLRKLRRLDEAIQSYQTCLALGPASPQVYNNLGHAHRDAQAPALALQAYVQALALAPHDVDALCGQAQCLCDLGAPEQALEVVARVLRQAPEHAAAHNEQANAHMLRKDYAQAQATYARATSLQADHYEAHNNLGNAWAMCDHQAKAIAAYDQAIAIDPSQALAWYNKGNALKNLRQYRAAIACYGHALRVDPRGVHILNSRGNAHLQLREEEAALHDFGQALQIEPDNIDALCNLAGVHKARRDFTQAHRLLERVHAIDPDSATLALHRGNLCMDSGQLEAAMGHYRQALERAPELPSAHMNLGIALLLAGQMTEGWSEYEWRWQTDLLKIDPGSARFPGLRWEGQTPVAGRRFLVFWEQGLGDTLQFARYADALQGLGAEVTLEVQAPLAPLLASLPHAPRTITRISQRGPADFHVPLLSLPLCFARAQLPAPGGQAYLRAPDERRQHWLQRLDDDWALSQQATPAGHAQRPYRVGLVCSGNPEHSNDRQRSLPLAQLVSALAPTGAVQRVCLQQALREPDLAWWCAQPAGSVHWYGEQLQDFADTAALCAAMDLVISVDTSVAHLAAALGQTTWILLPHVPDWRWQMLGSQSPWYDAVRLYRQGKDSGWPALLQSVSEDLQRCVLAAQR